MIRSRQSAGAVRECAVRIFGGGGFLGAGFFVARRLVVTCAHVVPDDEVTVEWGSGRIGGAVVLRVPESGEPGDYYPYPDLALIRLPIDAPEHPVADVDDRRPAPTAPLLVHGFSGETPEAGLAPMALSLTVVDGESTYMRVKGDRITRGFSGSMAVNPDTGRVGGIVKATSGQRSEAGGWLIPSAALVRVMGQYIDGPHGGVSLPSRPDPGSPLHRLLKAQAVAAERLPYRLVDDPVPPLSAVYVEQFARRDGTGVTEIGEGPTRTVVEMVSRQRHSVVVGEPGAGKSTLGQYVVARTSGWWLNPAESGEPVFGRVIAVRVAATDLVGPRSWNTLVARAIERQLAGHLDESPDSDWFNEGPLPGMDWLIIVDGVDEVVDPAQRRHLVEVLRERLAEIGPVRLLISTRLLPGNEMDLLLRGRQPWNQQDEYRLCPFDDDALAEFARMWFMVRKPESDNGRTVAADFLRRIDDSRLRQLIRIPLLATIAAIVYERHPQAPLPVDRTELYSRFMAYLLHERRGRIKLRSGLRAALAEHGAESLADELFARTEELLERVAVAWVDENREPWETARHWAETELPDLVSVPQWRKLLESTLLSTGVLVANGERMEFLHQSFAEYFAAGDKARSFRARAWLNRARQQPLSSLDLFTFARTVKAGLPPWPVLKRIQRPTLVDLVRAKTIRPEPGEVRRESSTGGRFLGRLRSAARGLWKEASWLLAPDLGALHQVLDDGLPLPAEVETRLLNQTLATVRRTPAIPELLLDNDIGTVLWQLSLRGDITAPVVQLLARPRLAPLKKILIGHLLLRLGVPDGRAALHDLMKPPRHEEIRVEAAWALAAAAVVEGAVPADDRERVLGVLRSTVTSGREDGARIHAAIALLDLGLVRQLLQAQLARAASPELSAAARVDAVDELEYLVPGDLYEYNGLALSREYGLLDTAVAAVTSVIAAPGVRFEHRTRLVELLDSVVPEVPGRATLVEEADRDERYGWTDRMYLAVAANGYGDPEALHRMSRDTELRPPERAYAAWLAGTEDAIVALSDMIAAEDSSLSLKCWALWALVRLGRGSSLRTNAQAAAGQSSGSLSDAVVGWAAVAPEPVSEIYALALFATRFLGNRDLPDRVMAAVLEAAGDVKSRRRTARIMLRAWRLSRRSIPSRLSEKSLARPYRPRRPSLLRRLFTNAPKRSRDPLS